MGGGRFKAANDEMQAGLERLSLPDAAIAASAERAGCTLLTRNSRDFGTLADLLAIKFYRNEP